MKWSNVIIVVAVVSVLVVLLAVGFRFDPRAVPSVLEGQPAPACELVDLDGTPVQLQQFRGRPVVVNFWSTWCVPCKTEHLILQNTAKHYGERVQFLGIVYQDEEAAARDYLKKRGMAYPQMLDPGSKCSIDYGVAGVPESFFIDATGVIRHKEAGPLSGAAIAAVLDPLVVGGVR